MKKFLVTLLILIIAGGVAFVFGWVQIQIPHDSAVVLETKTGGIHDEVVVPGKFSWYWERLIPTNMTKHVFTSEPVIRDISVTGSLPSEELYSRYMMGDPDFTWEIDLKVSFTINNDSLPALVREGKITPDTVEEYQDSIFVSLKSSVQQFVQGQWGSDRQNAVSDLSSGELRNSLETHLGNAFPEIIIHELVVNPVRMPDITLYMTARDRYLRLTETEFRIREEELARATADEVSETSRIETLREYGKLLSEYPVLMEYLDIKGTFDELTPISAESGENGAPPQ